MSSNVPRDFQCEQCGAIVRELRDAWRAGRMRFRETWLSSGRDLQDFRKALISLLPEVLDDEVRQAELLQAHFPDVAEAERRKAEHEALTGHSVHKDGWRSAGFHGLSDLL
jgi:hypothetical protein